MPSSAPGLPGLPPELAGPVAVELAKPVRDIPPAERAARAAAATSRSGTATGWSLVRQGGSTRLWSKQGRDLTDRFPDVAAAALAQLPAGHGGRRRGGRLERRAARLRAAAAPDGHRRRRGSPPLVAAHPASYVAFDLLAVGGTDLRAQPLRRRRAELERLAARWAPPLQLSPVTGDPAEARQWFTDFRAAGVEGLVAKGAGTRYAPGRREWLKVKSWETTEVIAGGVIGADRAAEPARRRGGTGTASSSSSAGPARSRPRRPPSSPPS